MNNVNTPPQLVTHPSLLQTEPNPKQELCSKRMSIFYSALICYYGFISVPIVAFLLVMEIRFLFLSHFIAEDDDLVGVLWKTALDQPHPQSI